MQILIVGGGGREHALAWCFHRFGHSVIAAPGNPGIATVAECVPVGVNDLDGICQVAVQRRVDLVVVGPEAPLVAGLADKLRENGIAVFGPGAAASQLEGSKTFAKRFFARHGIRSAEFVYADTVAEADAAIDRMGADVVVKADGLAAGKGVVVCSSIAEAKASVREMIEARRFGDAGARVIIERKIVGRELSIMALTDGTRLEVLAQAEDHKAVFDGDKGPNTGGMGTVSPPSWADDTLVARVVKEILTPTLVGLDQDNIDYRGVLYAGLMVEPDGTPWLLEYNCRFGDPETQPILCRVNSDLAQWLRGAATGELPKEPLTWEPRSAVCVVVASPGYPGKPQLGSEIHGLQELAEMEHVVVFHAGTKQEGEVVVTSGGRVLGITGVAETNDLARDVAYRAVEKIDFPGVHYRRDIGRRDIKQ